MKRGGAYKAAIWAVTSYKMHLRVDNGFCTCEEKVAEWGRGYAFSKRPDKAVLQLVAILNIAELVVNIG